MILISTLILALSVQTPDVDPSKPFLVRHPSLSADSIVFEFGTDLWTVSRSGGRAKRLTVGPGIESNPRYSLDGQWIAFTGEYEGNPDVYVVSAKGGQPKRLTWHPGADEVQGWTPDGKSILFTSAAEQPNGQARLYTVPAEGGWPVALPLPRGMAGSYSPDGTRIAYIPHDLWQPDWKRYKGGQTTPIWIAQLSDSKIEKVPRENSQDRNPMWVGDQVYFTSDREGRYTLFSYDTKTKQVSRQLAPSDTDIRSASAGPGAIVFERLGSINLFDLATKSARKVPILIEDDFLEVRPEFKPVGDMIANFDISPTGVRAVFEARGEIFTAPVEKGDSRNLTQTSGVADRSPIWSPDGKKIAYVNDSSGNYRLAVEPSMGGPAEMYELSEYPSTYHSLAWSPDSTKIVYVDQTLRLRYLDLATKKSVVVDREPYYLFGDSLNPSWSPDSKWIVYTKRGKNKLGAVWAYSLETGQSSQVTDGLSDAQNATFDRDGKYLYFLASTDIAETISLGGMSSMNHPISYSAYLVVLKASDPSPLAPESDEEKIEAAPAAPPTPPAATPPAATPPTAPAPATPKALEVKIDFDGIGQRILGLPIPPANYQGLYALTPGNLLVIRNAAVGFSPPEALRFSLKDKKLSPWAQGVQGVAINPKGDKALLASMGGYAIVGTQAPVQPGQGRINTSGLVSRVDPRAEWRQMFREVWHNMRDYLYDPNVHGLDIEKVMARYEPFLANLTSRNDFNYLMLDMNNEVTIGHTFSGGGDVPSSTPVPGGLLGADYSLENGRYRFARIYNGENWNPSLRAPLTQPGAAVKAGEYLLAVNGKEITTKDNVYTFFEYTAGKQVRIKVGPNPDGKDSREVTVVPTASESALRYNAWVEDNRRLVDRLSGGKISYVYMPDTSPPGYASFNRYFTAQLDKDAVLVDDRFNGGGFLSDYVIQILTRKVLGNANQRDFEDFHIPIFANEGPKAMLINEMAGSGGDALPWFFRTAQVGPLVGMRTWGGLVAAGQGLRLIGGGGATSPQVAIYGLKGEWEVENNGVPPDIEVEEDPYLWRQGHDPQLERAVQYLMQELQAHPVPQFKRPAYPNYHKNTGLGKGG